jgi:hypothetical protein
MMLLNSTFFNLGIVPLLRRLKRDFNQDELDYAMGNMHCKIMVQAHADVIRLLPIQHKT